jgi:hypothetical protein
MDLIGYTSFYFACGHVSGLKAIYQKMQAPTVNCLRRK